MKWRFLAVFLLLSHTAVGAPAATPVRAAQGFFDTYLATRPSGVPTEEELQRLRPHLSAALFELLREAGRAEAAYAAATHHEVPPLVEGDLFTSLFEGATAYAVTRCDAQGTGAVCTVALTAADPAGGPSAQWQDRLHLIRAEQRWLVDDISYGGTWAFGNKGRLQAALRALIDDAPTFPPGRQERE